MTRVNTSYSQPMINSGVGDGIECADGITFGIDYEYNLYYAGVSFDDLNDGKLVGSFIKLTSIK